MLLNKLVDRCLVRHRPYLRRLRLRLLHREQVDHLAPAPHRLVLRQHAGRRGHNAMARTHREIAIEQMVRTVEEAMSQAINWWGDLPPPMKEAVEQFRIQLGAAIDSVEFVRRALDRQLHETDRGKGPA